MANIAGISERDEEYYRKAEDQEQFENVNAVARPAATKMRTRKLNASQSRWQGWQHDLKGSDYDELVHRGRSISAPLEAIVLADELREADELVEDASSSEPGSSGSQEQDKVAQIKRRKVEELMTLNEFLKKSSAAEEQKEEEKPTQQQEAVALRGLGIMQRNHLLEDTLYNNERTTLCEFFGAADQKPTQTKPVDMSMLIMEGGFAVTNYCHDAIDTILMRPDMFDDVVDNELRIFLLDTAKAKHILLDVMLLHPEFVPQTWGGGMLVKRKQQAVAEAEQKRQATVAEDQTVRDDDLIEITVPQPKPPVAPQRKVEASPQKV
ncbi:hypothetical protein OSTOST_16080, partial [Ostertagia ostertagi]